MALSCSKIKRNVKRNNIKKPTKDGSYCLNCLHSFRTKKKLESHEQACENKDICNLIMLSEDPKTPEFNQYQNSDKVLFNFYADLECL